MCVGYPAQDFARALHAEGVCIRKVGTGYWLSCQPANETRQQLATASVGISFCVLMRVYHIAYKLQENFMHPNNKYQNVTLIAANEFQT